MIEEKFIQESIDELENEDFVSQALDPELLVYLETEIFNLLSKVETDVLTFCIEVINQSIIKKHKSLPDFDLEDFNNKEEVNWTLREDSSSWESAKDSFFKEYKEEDLLAFVEDILVEDEDDQLSKISKEFIFITSKSYIDSMCAY